jgi:hypothetical protein
MDKEPLISLAKGCALLGDNDKITPDLGFLYLRPIEKLHVNHPENVLLRPFDAKQYVNQVGVEHQLNGWACQSRRF